MDGRPALEQACRNGEMQDGSAGRAVQEHNAQPQWAHPDPGFACGAHIPGAYGHVCDWGLGQIADQRCEDGHGEMQQQDMAQDRQVHHESTEGGPGNGKARSQHRRVEGDERKGLEFTVVKRVLSTFNALLKLPKTSLLRVALTDAAEWKGANGDGVATIDMPRQQRGGR